MFSGGATLSLPVAVTRASVSSNDVPSNLLILFGERGGTRTRDPMIKSHVLYRLSYALTPTSSMIPSEKAGFHPAISGEGFFP
jgi:hypothetical protein